MVFYCMSLNVTVTAEVATQINKFADFTLCPQCKSVASHPVGSNCHCYSNVTVWFILYCREHWLGSTVSLKVGTVNASLSHVHVIEYGKFMKFIKFFEWFDGQKNAWSTSPFTINILYCDKYA